MSKLAMDEVEKLKAELTGVKNELHKERNDRTNMLFELKMFIDMWAKKWTER